MNNFNENDLKTVNVWWDWSKIVYSAFCSSIHTEQDLNDKLEFDGCYKIMEE